MINVDITVMLSKFTKRDHPIVEEDEEKGKQERKRENPKLVSVILRCSINIIALIIGKY